MELVEIKMGDFSIGEGIKTLTTSGVGSCIVVCLYSTARKAGGLAHIMLPRRHMISNDGNLQDYRYADVAIAAMIDQLTSIGIPSNMLTAKIAGGANMFPDVQGRSQKVGEKNLSSVKEILQEFHISIAAEDSGGTHGRSVSFDLPTGIVTIKKTI